MTRSLKSLWGRFLFQDRGILPTKRLMYALLVISAILIILAVWGVSWLYVILVNCIFFLISLLDLLFSPKKNELTFKRTLPDELERNIRYTVKVEIRNRSNYTAYLQLIDGIPQSFDRNFPLTGVVGKQESLTISYDTVARTRGKYPIEKLYVRFTSFLGLWNKQITVMLNETIKVIPDLSETKQYLESAQQFLLHEGMEIRRQKQGGGEFAKIRTYVVGDDPRKINWRQTAKLQEVMTNEYEPEHGKYISILIDCGRMMGAELTESNRLEKVIEAALTVAAAALKNGDYVSVLAFSKDIKVFVPAGKGMKHLQTILHSIYDIKVDANESNYSAVLNYLQTVQKKRSLILLFSDVQTFLYEESALVYLKRLRQQHLFLMIGIEDETFAARINQKPKTVQLAMVKSIAQQQTQIKIQEKAKWEQQGLPMIEAKQERLAATAVSYYIDIMNRGLL